MATPRKNGPSNSTNSTRMQQLYRRLSQVGFSRSFVCTHVLPPAWQEEAATNDTVYQKVLVFLSTSLGILLEDLQEAATPLTFSVSRTRLFVGRDIFEEADATQQVAQGVARVALSGVPREQPHRVPPAAQLRRELLQQDKPWVSFRDLLAYCWGIQVPVLHVQHLPAKSTKHKGIAVEVDGASAIVLCQKHASPAWHLKALAHEVGHLTQEDADLVNRPATTQEQVHLAEQSEAAASRFATHLVTGGQEVAPDTQPYRWPKDLVAATYDRARDQHIDPSYLILRRGVVTNNWQEANAAFRIIDAEEGVVSANKLINELIQSHVSTRRISPEDLYFFQHVTGSSLRRYYQPPNSAVVIVSTVSPNVLAEEDIYPEYLVTRYKALSRQRRQGGLTSAQEEELVGLREQVQAISRSDERSQEAVRRAEAANVALAGLESAIDARGEQRRAELVGAEKQND